MDLSLRHTLATLAYRTSKMLRDTPESFRDFRIRDSARTPGLILAHMGDLLDWALAQVEGRKEWRSSQPLAWGAERARFFHALEKLDQRIAQHGLGEVSAEILFQGAIADTLTHAGQLALLRRMAGIPVLAENYSKAEIALGRVGSEQAPARLEFD